MKETKTMILIQEKNGSKGVQI